MLGIVALLSSNLTPAVAAADRALKVAERTGEIIGAGGSCGMEAGDLVSIGYGVMGWIRNQGTSPNDLKRAQSAHYAAVARGAARIAKEGPSACAAATAVFRDLQREIGQGRSEWGEFPKGAAAIAGPFTKADVNFAQQVT